MAELGRRRLYDEVNVAEEQQQQKQKQKLDGEAGQRGPPFAEGLAVFEAHTSM